MISETLIFLLSLFSCLILIRYLNYFKVQSVSTSVMLIVFLIKLVSAQLYMKILPDAGDALIFFQDGLLLSEYLKTDPLQFLRIVFGTDTPQHFINNSNYWIKPFSEIIPNDNRTVIVFHACCALVSNGSFLTHTLIANFLSLIGLIGIFKFLSKSLTINVRLLFVGVFLTPSVLFWGSAMQKEPLLLFAFGCTLLVIMDFIETAGKWKIVSLLIFTVLSLIVKPYVMIIAIPGLISYYVSSRFDEKKLFPFFATFSITLIMLLGLTSLHRHTNIAGLLHDKQGNYITLSEIRNETPDIVLPVLDGSWSSVFQGLPLALCNGVVQPLFSNRTELLALLPRIELGILFLIGLFLVIKPRQNLQFDNTFYFSLTFILMFSVFLGFLIPISGTLIRLKMIMLPFLVYSFLALTRRSITV